MKREIRFRSTIATGVVVVLLLGVTPTYARSKKQKSKYAGSPIQRLVVWVQTRMTPPLPEPDPTTTDGVIVTTTDVPGTST
jgi:hypothetical protein